MSVAKAVLLFRLSCATALIDTHASPSPPSKPRQTLGGTGVSPPLTTARQKKSTTPHFIHIGKAGGGTVVSLLEELSLHKARARAVI